MTNKLTYLLLLLLALSCNSSNTVTKSKDEQNILSGSQNYISIVPDISFSQPVVGVSNSFSMYVQNKTSLPLSDLSVSLAPSPVDLVISKNNCDNIILEPLQSCQIEITSKFNDAGTKVSTLIVSSNNYVAQSEIIIKVVPASSDLMLSNTFKKIDKNTPFSDNLTNYIKSGKPSVFELVSSPSYGELSLNSLGEILYKPNKNYTGLDSFAFIMKSDNGVSNTATYQIFIAEDESQPQALDQELLVSKNGQVAIVLAGTDPEGKQLTYSIVSHPLKGTLSGSSNKWTYTAPTEYIGVDGFTFKVNNGKSDSATATVNLLIQESSLKGVAQNENSKHDLESSDSSREQSSDSAKAESPSPTLIQPATGGAVAIPTPVEKIVDRVVATEKTITKIEVPIIPSADDQTLEIEEDTALEITLTGQGEGELTYSLLSNPVNGSLSGSGQTWSYTPNLNFSGNDSFTIKINNGKYDSNVATINIRVLPVNEEPVLLDSLLATNEDSPYSFSIATQDPDGDTLTVEIDSPTSNGNLSYNSTSKVFSYIPNFNFNGTDSFNLKVSDGQLSTYKSYTITVNPVNDTPAAESQIISLQEDNAKLITLTATDVDGDSLTYTITAPPTHGSLSGSGNSWTYTPNTNYHGADSFAFKVNDGLIDSSPVMVYLMVTQDNQKPQSADQTLSVIEDGVLPITLTGSDADGNNLNYIIVSAPNKGTLTGTGASYTYSPNKDYNGVDSFSYKIYDGYDYSDVYTVNITVTPGDDTPVAFGEFLTVEEDTSKNIILKAEDGDGDALTYTIVLAPTHGNLTGSGTNWVYTPALDYYGPDLFKFKVNDGTSDSNLATVSLSVSPVNDAPVAIDGTLNSGKNRAKTIKLQAIDPDGGDVLTYTIVSQPGNGVLTGSGNSWTYTPNTGFEGSDIFTFKVTDGQEESNTASIIVDIDSVNDLPIAFNGTATTAEDTPKTITLQAEDDDNDPLTYTIIANPAHGTLTGSGDSWTYTPNANYVGSDSFKFLANDGTGDSNLATVSITITPVNDAPVANNQSVTLAEDTSKSITLTASDVENNPLTYTIVTQPLYGVLSGSGTSWTYTPDPNYFGSDSFTFKANDTTLNSAPATVSITVTPVNDAPIANNLSFSVNENDSYSGTLPGVDFDGDTLTYTITGTPTQGTVTIINSQTGAFVYTPSSTRANAGTDSFSFQVFDGTSFSTYGNVSVTINDVQMAPVANNLSITTPQNTAKSGTVTATDQDNNALTYTIVTSPSHGTVTFDTNGNFTYTPANNYFGPDSFTFKANDGTFDSNSATVSISVTFVNTAPVAQNKTIDMYVDQGSATGQLTATDVNNDPLTYTVVGSSTDLVLNADGSFTFTDSINTVRTVTYQFKTNDGSADSNTATLTINIKLRDNFLKITANPNLLTTSLADFPFVIDLQVMAHLDHFWQNIQADGGDLIVTLADKTTRVPVDLRNFNRANRTGELWFKASVTQDVTNSFYIHYNNDGTTDLVGPAKDATFGSYNVWSNGYMGAWDMSLKNGVVKNAKSANSDLTPLNQAAAYSFGYIDEASTFNIDNGTNDAMVTDSNSELQTSNYITLSAWVYSTKSSTDATVIRKFDLSARPSYGLYIDAAKPAFWVGGNGGTKLRSGTALDLNQWHYISATYSKPDSRMKLYVNGVLITQKSFSGVITQTNGKIEIGGTEIATRAFPGALDQITASSVERTSAWLLAEYRMMNNKNNFWIFDDEVIVSSDDFNRAESTTVGFSWTELEGNSAPASGLTIQQQGMLGIYTTSTANASGLIRVESEMLNFYNLNNPRGYPEARRAWTAISSGKAYISFIVDLYRSGTDNQYSFHMNFGESFKSIGELIWGSPSLGLSSLNGFGVVNKGNLSIDQMTTVNHRELVVVSIDFSSKTFNVYLKGKRRTGIPFDDSTSLLNKISFIANEIDSDYIPRVYVDNFVLKKQ